MVLSFSDAILVDSLHDFVEIIRNVGSGMSSMGSRGDDILFRSSAHPLRFHELLPSQIVVKVIRDKAIGNIVEVNVMISVVRVLKFNH